ncbi:MAG: thioredoxin [Candidatus Dependentiae bacterium]|nr:thioredoxin [Candidatus Dependentiae bacterium]
MVISVSKDNYDEVVTKSHKPVILDISASWCGPCQQVKPIFEHLAKELGEQYTFGEVNVDESRDIAIKFGVTSVPTFIFLKDGQIKGKERGYMAEEDFKAKIKQHLG